MKITILSYNIEGLTLEYNYCQDQSLKQYIIDKSVYLNKYLATLNVDIICIQEYTPILNIDLENYYCVKTKPNAIFFRKGKFTYVNHKEDDAYGLIVKLNTDGFIVKIGTNRLPPGFGNEQLRSTIMATVDAIAKNKILVYAADTNMKKAEEKVMTNLVDCYHLATVTDGHYTLDKKTNPYFANDDASEVRTRYDKIFCTKIFDCEQTIVLKPVNNDKLVHTSYPFGGISDHYPVMAVLSIG